MSREMSQQQLIKANSTRLEALGPDARFLLERCP